LLIYYLQQNRPCWIEDGVKLNIFIRGKPKDNLPQVWFSGFIKDFLMIFDKPEVPRSL
jgi:hypothetical protein